MGGLFGNDPLHAANSCYAALEISEFIRKRKLEKEKSGLEYWDIRIGLHTGELVAGVIGDKNLHLIFGGYSQHRKQNGIEWRNWENQCIRTTLSGN